MWHFGLGWIILSNVDLVVDKIKKSKTALNISAWGVKKILKNDTQSPTYVNTGPPCIWGTDSVSLATCPRTSNEDSMDKTQKRVS